MKWELKKKYVSGNGSRLCSEYRSPCATFHTRLISKNEVMRFDMGVWLAAEVASPTFSPAICVGFAAVPALIISTRAPP